jgi:hypothetical protein
VDHEGYPTPDRLEDPSAINLDSSEAMANTGGARPRWGFHGAALTFADHPPHTMYTPMPLQPDFSAVDMDELSASLGLPSAKKETAIEDSPARSHRSRSSQGLPDGLHGKLIDRALAKPLTADALAHYLRRRSSSEGTATTIRELRDSSRTFATPDRGQDSGMKIVGPPPGFGNGTPRMIAIEEDVPIASTVQHPRAVPTGPANYMHHRYPSVSGSSSPFQHHHRSGMSGSNSPFQQNHARRPSDRRRPRRQARTRRTDQGPEPSTADIYPDDARWEPPQEPGHQTYYAGQPHNMPRRHPTQFHAAPQPELRVEDSGHWPTPAEVYQPEQGQPPVPGPPSVDDLSAADPDVHTLLEEMPAPSVNTMIHFGALDLVGDNRSLTPDQENGKRYGMQYNGLGIGDDWQLAPVARGGSYENVEAFRVRPRNHEGWGGWEWAVRRGWADE